MAITNLNFSPTDNIISMENRRKYQHIEASTTGMVSEFKGYPFQIVDVKPTDVILLHISDDLDLLQCKNIQKEMNEIFPNNTVILCNEHILKGLTILRGETTKIDNVVDIKTTVDIDKLYDEIMKGHPNDFLH